MCVICLENKKEYNLSCNHSFCSNCLLQLFQSDLNLNCPLCRRNIINTDINHIKLFLPRQTRSETLYDRSLDIREYISICLTKINKDSNISNKKIIITELFNYIFENKWFLNGNKKFSDIFIKKIIELKKDHKDWSDIKIFYYKFKNSLNFL